MVAPVDGLFTVTLAPSAVPGRQRWQFFWKEADKKLAALSLLRDEEGWVDLEEKSGLARPGSSGTGTAAELAHPLDAIVDKATVHIAHIIPDAV